MFILMFITFLIQITARYFFVPILWTSELTLLCFLWIILLGACFAERSREIISFSLLYDKQTEKGKRIFDILSCILLIVAFSVSWIPSLQFIIYMNYKRSVTMQFLRYSFIFFPYMIFLTIMIIRYGYRLYTLLRTSVKGDVSKL
ncbi:MAG: TRAP transporter small permease subunit [Spirochaetia bacterium]|nr:TRAP transporter small permease subunit [Spirochaetia bacterium]